MDKFTCPCCGYKTLIFEIGDICQICFWEDDAKQRKNPDLENATNINSLRQAQKDFSIGKNINRQPSEKDLKDENWVPLPQTVTIG